MLASKRCFKRFLFSFIYFLQNSIRTWIGCWRQSTDTSPAVDRYSANSQWLTYRRVSAAISTEISAGSRSICRPISRLINRSICRPTYLGRHLDRHSTDMWTDISVDTRPICRPIHWSRVGRYVDRYIGRGVHKIHMIRICWLLIYSAYTFCPVLTL